MRVLYPVVIAGQSNTPVSQFNGPCTEFTSVWSMFTCNTSKNSDIQVQLHLL